ncbi:hypothetical protein BHM03_00046637 [Ensete ventricosum]|nr:hypothetical protein BHM03_00046637 [Ensete ventricosum]
MGPTDYHPVTDVQPQQRKVSVRVESLTYVQEIYFAAKGGILGITKRNRPLSKDSADCAAEPSPLCRPIPVKEVVLF